MAAPAAARSIRTSSLFGGLTARSDSSRAISRSNSTSPTRSGRRTTSSGSRPSSFSKGGRPVEAYAYARTGYHRGLDALRRSGWKGYGPVPWSHEPNQGFLRCLAALATAAGQIHETDEEHRCWTFLQDSSKEAYEALKS